MNNEHLTNISPIIDSHKSSGEKKEMKLNKKFANNDFRQTPPFIEHHEDSQSLQQSNNGLKCMYNINKASVLKSDQFELIQEKVEGYQKFMCYTDQLKINYESFKKKSLVSVTQQNKDISNLDKNIKNIENKKNKRKDYQRHHRGLSLDFCDVGFCKLAADKPTIAVKQKIIKDSNQNSYPKEKSKKTHKSTNTKTQSLNALSSSGINSKNAHKNTRNINHKQFKHQNRNENISTLQKNIQKKNNNKNTKIHARRFSDVAHITHSNNKSQNFKKNGQNKADKMIVLPNSSKLTTLGYPDQEEQQSVILLSQGNMTEPLPMSSYLRADDQEDYELVQKLSTDLEKYASLNLRPTKNNNIRPQQKESKNTSTLISKFIQKIKKYEHLYQDESMQEQIQKIMHQERVVDQSSFQLDIQRIHLQLANHIENKDRCLRKQEEEVISSYIVEDSPQENSEVISKIIISPQQQKSADPERSQELEVGKKQKSVLYIKIEKILQEIETIQARKSIQELNIQQNKKIQEENKQERIEKKGMGTFMKAYWEAIAILEKYPDQTNQNQQKVEKKKQKQKGIKRWKSMSYISQQFENIIKIDCLNQKRSTQQLKTMDKNNKDRLLISYEKHDKILINHQKIEQRSLKQFQNQSGQTPVKQLFFEEIDKQIEQNLSSKALISEVSLQSSTHLTQEWQKTHIQPITFDLDAQNNRISLNVGQVQRVQQVEPKTGNQKLQPPPVLQISPPKNQDQLEDIIQFIFIDLCVEMEDQFFYIDRKNIHGLNLMKKLKMIILAQNRKKGFNTNRKQLVVFLSYALKHIKQLQIKDKNNGLGIMEKQILKNLRTAIGPTPLQLLKFMRESSPTLISQYQSAFKQPALQQNNSEDEQKDYNSDDSFIFKIQWFEPISKAYMQQYDFGCYYFQQEREQRRLTFLKNAMHIYHKAIFDCLNEIADKYRRFGIFGQPFPWKIPPCLPLPTISGAPPSFSLTNNNLKEPRQISSLLNGLMKQCQENSLFLCGLLYDKQYSYNITSVQALELREDRLCKMLAREILDNELRWLFYDDQEAEVLVGISEQITSYLITEVLKDYQVIMEKQDTKEQS